MAKRRAAFTPLQHPFRHSEKNFSRPLPIRAVKRFRVRDRAPPSNGARLDKLMASAK